jgi:hypothetical protein
MADDVQAAIRRNLGSQRKLASVSRRRSFRVSLTDPTASAHPFERDTFGEFHRTTLRSWLGKVEKCRIFSHDDSTLPDWHRESRQSKLEHVGARPAEWLAAYTTRKGEQEHLLLTPEAIDDELFWWWALTQRPSMGMVFLVTIADYDWVSFFQRAYEPHIVGGSRPPELDIGKQETRRNGMAAFILSNNLEASVVASSPNIEKLFGIAVDHAIVIPQLHPFAFVQ